MREIELSVLGNDAPRASLPGEVVPDREFYDYDSKYAADSRTGLLIPAPLDAAATAEAQRLARGGVPGGRRSRLLARRPLLERKSGRLLVNEINTMPGFTSISMFPKLWEASGLGFSELLAQIVSLARERHQARERLSTERQLTGGLAVAAHPYHARRSTAAHRPAYRTNNYTKTAGSRRGGQFRRERPNLLVNSRFGSSDA